MYMTYVSINNIYYVFLTLDFTLPMKESWDTENCAQIEKCSPVILKVT
jgi:hypothetical protein